MSSRCCTSAARSRRGGRRSSRQRISGGPRPSGAALTCRAPCRCGRRRAARGSGRRRRPRSTTCVGELTSASSACAQRVASAARRRRTASRRSRRSRSCPSSSSPRRPSRAARPRRPPRPSRCRRAAITARAFVGGRRRTSTVGPGLELGADDRDQRQPLEPAIGAEELERRSRWPASASTSTGGPYCSSTPPTLSTAMRSPRRMASSMSWVTNTMVLCSRRWRSSSSSCRRGAHDRDRPRRTARPSAAPADRRPARGPRRRAAAGRRRARRDSASPSSASRPTSSISSSTRALMRALSQPSSSGTVAMLLGDRAVREQPDLLDHVADREPQLVRLLRRRRRGRRR